LDEPASGIPRCVLESADGDGMHADAAAAASRAEVN
jgi:hypothetical protein